MKILALSSLLFLSGCLLATARSIQKMTPEQIDAYGKVRMQVFGCLQVDGPPGGGAITYMVLPQDTKLDLQFAPNCTLLSGKVTR